MVVLALEPWFDDFSGAIFYLAKAFIIISSNYIQIFPSPFMFFLFLKHEDQSRLCQRDTFL
jgi:hypothetical protein